MKKKNRVDNFKTLNYGEQRCLDALARLFDVSPNQSLAIIFFENKYYFCFNYSIRDINPTVRVYYFNKIKDALFRQGNIEEAFSYCLLTNQGYLTFLRKFSEATGLEVCNDYCLSLMQKSQTFTKLLNQNHQKLLKGKIQIDDIDISELLNSTTREFWDFINYFYNKLNEESPEEDKTKIIKTLEVFIRPLQDIYKIVNFTKTEKGANLNSDNIIVLGNEFLDSSIQFSDKDKFNGIHGEVNLAIFFKWAVKNEQYIGTSKLCCAICDEILLDLGFNHRGTHGIFYHNYKTIFGRHEQLKERVSVMQDMSSDDKWNLYPEVLSDDEEYENNDDLKENGKEDEKYDMQISTLLLDLFKSYKNSDNHKNFVLEYQTELSGSNREIADADCCTLL